MWRTFTGISWKYLQPTVSRLSYHVFWNTPCSFQLNQTLLQKLLRIIAYSSHEPSASSGVCVWQSSFCNNVHDIMDDHFLTGNNLVSKNVQNSKHKHTRTHPLAVWSQTMYIYIGHTSDQIELCCHLYPTRSTNNPVTPWVTPIPTYVACHKTFRQKRWQIGR